MVWEYFFVPFSRVPVHQESIGLDQLIVEWQGGGPRNREQLKRDAREVLAGRSPSADRVAREFLIAMIGKGYSRQAVQDAAEFVGMPSAARRVAAHYASEKIADGAFLNTLVPMQIRMAMFGAFAGKGAAVQAATIPDPTDIAAREYFQTVFAENVRKFVDRVGALTTRLPGKGAYEEHYVRNLSDMRAVFRKWFGRIPRHAQTLSRVMSLSDNAYVGRTIDLLVSLRPADGARGYQGWSARVKSNESIARKWATKLKNIAHFTDGLAQMNRGPEAFPLTFEDLTITDILGITFILYHRDDAEVQKRLTQAQLVTLERSDSRQHTISSDAWQVQLKVYDRGEKLIYDVHVATLEDMLELEFGKSAHHLRTTRRHQKNMHDPLYRMAYRRALEFLDACNLPGIDPELRQVMEEQDAYRRRMLLQLQEERLFHRQFGLKQEEIKLLRQQPKRYLDNLEGEPEDRRALERVLDGYLWAYAEALSVGLSVFERDPLFQTYLLQSEIRALQDEILLLDQLYEKLYPQGNGLREQRMAFHRELPYLRAAGEMLYRTDMLQCAVRATAENAPEPGAGDLTLDQAIRDARALFLGKRPKEGGHGQRLLLEAQIHAATVALEGYTMLLRSVEGDQSQNLKAARAYLTQVHRNVERLWPNAANGIPPYGDALNRLRQTIAEISPGVSDEPSARS